MMPAVRPIRLCLAALLAAGIAIAPVRAANVETINVPGLGVLEVDSYDAKVVKVDREKRKIWLKGLKGNQYAIPVPPVFGPLDRVKAGNNLRIRFIEGVLTDVSKPKTGTPGLAIDDTVVQGELDGYPADFFARRLVAVTKLVSVDAAKGTASFEGFDHIIHEVKAQAPAVKAALKTMSVGDLVQVTYIEATSIRILS